MTISEIKNQVMFQTNNDAEDIDDYLPHLIDYINDGYDRIVAAWVQCHIPAENYPKLEADTDVPNTPEWTHRALVDWATWLVYRNGNPQKQNRGMAYYNAFQEVLSKISDMGGASGLNPDGTQKQYKYFVNIPD